MELDRQGHLSVRGCAKSLDAWRMELSRRHFLALGLTAVSGAAALGAANERSRRAGGPGFANPTLPIVALAARLALELRRELS